MAPSEEGRAPWGNGVVSVLNFFRPGTKRRLLRGERVAWIENRDRADYIRKVVLSYPPWVDRKELEEIWKECRRREIETGVRHVIDHIVPISHPMVSGLSVPWNLRVVTFAVNASKGNRWDPNQLELDLELVDQTYSVNSCDMRYPIAGGPGLCGVPDCKRSSQIGSTVGLFESSTGIGHHTEME